MAIDFEIPEEAKAVRERVRQWVHDECIPAEKRVTTKEDYQAVLAELRAKARAQGLWLPFIPKADGGMGLGPRPSPWCRWSWARAFWAPCR